MDSTIRKRVKLQKELNQILKEITQMDFAMSYTISEKTGKGFFRFETGRKFFNIVKMNELMKDEKGWSTNFNEMMEKEKDLLQTNTKGLYTIEAIQKNAEKARVFIVRKREDKKIHLMGMEERKAICDKIKSRMSDANRRWIDENQLLSIFCPEEANDAWEQKRKEQVFTQREPINQLQKIIEKKINKLLKEYNRKSNEQGRQGE